MCIDQKLSPTETISANDCSFDDNEFLSSTKSELSYLSKLKKEIEALEPKIRLTPVELMPISVRLSNVFKRENISTLHDFSQVESASILRWSGLGRITIRQLSRLVANLKDGSVLIPCFPGKIEPNEGNSIAIELDNINHTIREKDSSAEDLERSSYCNPHRQDTSLFYAFKLKALILNAPEHLRQADIEIFNISARLENVFHAQNVKNLNDILEYSDYRIASWPSLGKKSLLQFCNILEGEGLQSIEAKLSNLLNHNEGIKSDSTTLKEYFKNSLEKLEKKIYRVILEERLGINGEPKTLEEIALEFNITRERVRQIQKATVRRIIKGETWDDILRVKIQSLLASKTHPLFIDELQIMDPWFSGFESNPQLLLKIIELFSNIEINSIKIDKRFLISNLSQETWETIRRKLLDVFEYSVDLDHTLEDLEVIVEAELKAHNSSELSVLMFDILFKELIFSNVDGDFLLTGVGNSKEQLIKAILEESKIPLHYEDIAQIYFGKYGVEIKPRNVHARLNYSKKFLIFERGVYGLNKHVCISPERCKDILLAAERVILSDLNKQWHSSEILKKVLEDNPNFFSEHLNKYTLNIILNESKLVQYLGKMVWTKWSVDNQEIERIHIRTAVANILRFNGGPMRAQEIQEELTKVRSVSSDIQLCLHPNALFSRTDPSTWGLLDRDFILGLNEWEKIKNHLRSELLVRNKAYHISELLSAIDAQSLSALLTEFHIFGILMADNRFKVWRGHLVGLGEWHAPNRLTVAEAFETVSKEVFNAISPQDIINRVQELLGHRFDRNTISLHMNRSGFSFDREENIWRRST